MSPLALTLCAILAELRYNQGMTMLADRVGALRALFSRHNISGYLIPRADEFQGEYVPASAERLAYISGFNGSAGMAVVLAETAALFVDGRYVLQAPKETDLDIYTVVQTPPASPADWLNVHAKGARIGYHPWLFTRDALKRLGKAGVVLVPVMENLVDAVWTDRPSPPMAPVEIHPLEFAGEATEAKRMKLVEQLKKAGVTSFALTQPDSIAWLLNIRGADVPCTPFALSYAILHDTGEVDWCVDEGKVGSEVRQHLGNAVRLYPLAHFAELLAALPGPVGVDATASPEAVFVVLGEKAKALTDPCQLPKACKNKIEVQGARHAHTRDGAALTQLLAWVDGKTDVTELDVMAKLRGLRAEGQYFRDLSFETIAGSGPHGAIVHYHADEKSNRALQAGEFLLLDSGGQYRDGTTDVTRTVAIGPVSEEMKRHFTLVLKGHIGIARAVFSPGTTGAMLDVLARQHLWAAGLDFDHGTGHGVGSYLSVHEGPQRISKASHEPLQVGMIISNEPGYYKAGAYGIRIESLVTVIEVAVTGGERPMLGFETLTMAPLDTRCILSDLLEKGEIDWVNSYHTRVRDTLTPLLDSAAAAWLAKATQPL
jgi:Xaa-Pro aminopeptidase